MWSQSLVLTTTIEFLLSFSHWGQPGCLLSQSSQEFGVFEASPLRDS